MVRRPPVMAGPRPMRSISVPTTRTSAYMPSTWAPMIGNTSCCVVVVVLDDDVAAEVHHRDHHAEARQRGEHRRPHSRPHDDLPQRRRGRAAVRRAPDQLGDPLRVRPHQQNKGQRTEADPAGCQPWHGQRGSVQLAPCEQRPEHGGTQDGAEHRAEQDVRDPARATLGRVHVAGRRADQQRDAAGPAGEQEAEDEDHRRVHVGRQRGEAAADGRQQVAARDHRPPADPVHQPARRDRRRGRRDEEDRRAEPEQPLDPGHEHERDRRHRRDELEHRRVDGHRRGEQQRVAPDVQADGRMIHSAM